MIEKIKFEPEVFTREIIEYKEPKTYMETNFTPVYDFTMHPVQDFSSGRCLYHYYGELRFFKEDLTCSFFFKLHLFMNYIFWIEWQKILTYLFLSDVLGYIIFYFSVTSWESKYKNCGYTIFHNIWHIYTGGLAFYVVMAEKRVDIGYWNGIYFMIFVGAIFSSKKRRGTR